MAVYLLCLTTSGGVPLFTRTVGDLKPLPFPVIGSLNGVHMFGDNHDISLLSTTTDDSKIVWRVFHDSITLIVVTEDDLADDCHLNNLLNYVFNSMVLLCGLDELTNIKNVEKLKREIKVCNQIVDKLIDGVDDLVSFSKLTNTVEVIASTENAVLQNFLDAFTEAAQSVYGCLIIKGKMVVATRKWWSLTSNELVLLLCLVISMSSCSSRDLPIFLPDSHPTVPHRLITFQLIKDVEVCVICGPSPSLMEIEPEVVRFWRPAYDSLKNVCRIYPRNFPEYVTLDSNILGFLLVNKETSRCLCSLCPINNQTVVDTDDNFSTDQRKEILESFYKKITGTLFTSVVEGSQTGPLEFSHQPQETYIVGEAHKCYAMQSGPYQLYVLFSDNIPTYAMRSVCHKTLAALTRDKCIQSYGRFLHQQIQKETTVQ